MENLNLKNLTDNNNPIIFLANDVYGFSWHPYEYDENLKRDLAEREILGYGLPPIFFKKDNLENELILELQHTSKILNNLKNLPNKQVYFEDIKRLEAVYAAILNFLLG